MRQPSQAGSSQRKAKASLGIDLHTSVGDGSSGWPRALWRCVATGAGLKDGEASRGQSAGVDVLRVRGAVQGGLGGAAVDFGKGVLQELDGGQDLRRGDGHHVSNSPLDTGDK